MTDDKRTEKRIRNAIAEWQALDGHASPERRRRMKRIYYHIQERFCAMKGCTVPPRFDVVTNRGRVDSGPFCWEHAADACSISNTIEAGLAATREAR